MEAEVKKSGAAGEVYPVRCDLRRESDIQDMFQLIRDKYGRLDICINNAGLAWKQDRLSEGDIKEWREMFDVSALVIDRKIILSFWTCIPFYLHSGISLLMVALCFADD